MRAMTRHALAPPLLFLMLFAASRLAIGLAGIAPDPDVVLNHWQNLDLALLHADPLGSLWNLQAQPPLWNAILALATAVAGPSAEGVTAVMHAFNIALSAASGLIFLSLLANLGVSRTAAAVLAVIALSIPAVIYYENVVFYPHLTFFHVMLLIWLVVRIRPGGDQWPLFAALSVLVSLSWIWAVFHPAFVLLFGASLAWWSRGGVRGAAAVAIAVMLALLPTAKNAVILHTPSASGWIGLNLAQTAPSLTPEQIRYCAFVPAQQDVSRKAVEADLHPVLTQAVKSSGYPNMNHSGLVARGAECFALAERNIEEHPIAWLQKQVEALVRSHQLLPYNYDVDPLGWDAMAPLERAQEQLGAFGRSSIIAIYLVLAYWAARESIKGSQRRLYLHLLFFIVYFTLVSHIANGREQHRMRYTIEPIYLFLTAGILMAAVRQASRFGWRLRSQPLADLSQRH
jgi:hypothetical protein